MLVFGVLGTHEGRGRHTAVVQDAAVSKICFKPCIEPLWKGGGVPVHIRIMKSVCACDNSLLTAITIHTLHGGTLNLTPLSWTFLLFLGTLRTAQLPTSPVCHSLLKTGDGLVRSATRTGPCSCSNSSIVVLVAFAASAVLSITTARAVASSIALSPQAWSYIVLIASGPWGAILDSLLVGRNLI